MNPLEINLKEDSPMKIIFTSEEYDEYTFKLEIIMKAFLNKEIEKFDYIDLINKTMTQKELLFMSTMHFMEVSNHIMINNMFK